MLRLATYKKEKKRAKQKKRKKEKNQIEGKGTGKAKKKKKARRVLLMKTKVTKHGSRIVVGPRERERVALSGPPHPLFFFFLGSVK